MALFLVFLIGLLLLECVSGFLVSLIGCTGFLSCLSECVLFVLFLLSDLSCILVFSSPLWGFLLGECVLSFISCL